MIRRALFAIAFAATGLLAFVACIEDERVAAFAPDAATTTEAGGDFVCGLISIGNEGKITCPSKTGDPTCSIEAHQGCCPGDPNNECGATCSSGSPFGCFSDGQCTGGNHCCVAGTVIAHQASSKECAEEHEVAPVGGAVTVCKNTCVPGTEVELCDVQSANTCPAGLSCKRSRYAVAGYDKRMFIRAVGACQPP